MNQQSPISLKYSSPQNLLPPVQQLICYLSALSILELFSRQETIAKYN
jgi:hypothetical protein